MKFLKPKGILTQGFGENPHLYVAFGWQGHPGEDYVQGYDKPVLAMHDGKVVQVSFNPNVGGRQIQILSPIENKLAYLTIYGHLSEQLVKVGDEVKMGDVIGREGNSGYVVSGGVVYSGDSDPSKKGNHTHYGVQIFSTDPPHTNTIFGISYKKLNINNGYAAFVDPKDFYFMSNAKFVQNGDTPEYGFYLPATSEEALIDKAKNLGLNILKPDGKIDFSKAIKVKGL